MWKRLKEAKKQICRRGSEERAVDYIEETAESGDQAAAVFDLSVTLHEAFEKIAGLADAADENSEEEGLGPGEGG